MFNKIFKSEADVKDSYKNVNKFKKYMNRRKRKAK